MRANERVPSVFAATAMMLGLMACSTPLPKTVLTEADVAKAPAVDHVHMLERLYWRADANHNWRLTREEARERLAITSNEFDKIDVRKRGCITLGQYLAYHEARANRSPDETQRVSSPR